MCTAQPEAHGNYYQEIDATDEHGGADGDRKICLRTFQFSDIILLTTYYCTIGTCFSDWYSHISKEKCEKSILSFLLSSECFSIRRAPLHHFCQHCQCVHELIIFYLGIYT